MNLKSPSRKDLLVYTKVLEGSNTRLVRHLDGMRSAVDEECAVLRAECTELDDKLDQLTRDYTVLRQQWETQRSTIGMLQQEKLAWSSHYRAIERALYTMATAIRGGGEE